MEPFAAAVLCVCWHFHDPQISQDITALSHANYHVRITAQKRLQQRNKQAIPLLLAEQRRKDVPLETVKRAEIITRSYTHWYYNPRPDGWPEDKLPWMDMIDSGQYPQISCRPPGDQERLLGSKHNNRNNLFWHYYRQIWEEIPFGAYPFGEGEYSHPAYRYATFLFVRDLFADGWDRSEIVQLLNEMALCEEAYESNPRP